MICYSDVLFWFVAIFVDILRINIDEPRFSGDSFSFFDILVGVGVGMVGFYFCDDSSMMHVFIGAGSFISVTLFVQKHITFYY